MDNDRHMFPGGNTPEGFFSYYQYILPQDRARHIFCLKGGPGVGKSTFMKKIGGDMNARGYPVEYMHCSSDPGSLDGIVIPKLQVALIDGTAPHVVDPRNPGAVDEIVNIGDHWNLSGIKANRQEIMADNAELHKRFARVYRYMSAAKRLYDDCHAIYDECMPQSATEEEFDRIMPLFDGIIRAKDMGRERKLFASAITPGGMVNYLDSLLDGYRSVFEVDGAGTQPAAFLKRVSEEALRRGLDVETYYCPMDPASKIEHLLLPKLSVAFMSVNRYHTVPKRAERIVDFGKYLDRNTLNGYSDTLNADTDQFERLMGMAVDVLHTIKALHDHMETFYIPNMDFDALSKNRTQILERILEMQATRG